MEFLTWPLFHVTVTLLISRFSDGRHDPLQILALDGGDGSALPQYKLSSSRICQPYRRSRYFTEQKIYCHQPGIEARSVSCPARRLVPNTDDATPAQKFSFESNKERNPLRSWIVNTQPYKYNIAYIQHCKRVFI
jgi:hypothetical protein